jgi:nucleoside-diphosphate-sugar epimerase
VKVLITGTDGYIGCLLAPIIRNSGHEVVGLDTRYFRDARLGSDPDSSYPTLDKDLRHVDAGDLEGFDAVMHLAGLSNDAMGQVSRAVTFEINHRATLRLATLAKAAGVRRFLYASSCSVYGRSHADIVNEASPLDPQTEYARCKMLDEQALSGLADRRFSPTFLRNATAYGASPRMRFDLVVNNLAGLAWTTRRIALVSDGTPWRPIVHLLDICGAFKAALGAPPEAVHNQVFNIGRSDENYQIREIAECVAAVFPGCELSFGASDPDQRSYRVSFEKAARQLPGFQCEWNLRRGVLQLRQLFERAQLTSADFHHRPFTRLKQLQHLLDEGHLDAQFFWTAEAGVRPG